MGSIARWASSLSQGVRKRDVAQRYIFRITSLTSHVPGLTAFGSMVHIVDTLSATGTTVVLSSHINELRSVKKKDCKPGRKKKRKIVNSIVAAFHLGRISILTWGIFALTSAALSCVSSSFLFCLSMHSAIKNAMSWRRAKRKSMIQGLIQDRMMKMAVVSTALKDPQHQFTTVQEDKLRYDLIRLQAQMDALYAVSVGKATESQQHVTDYLIYKQREKTKASKRNMYIGVVGALSAISLGLAFFFPPAALVLGFVGSAGYALSAVFRVAHHHQQTGYNFFFGCFKSQNQRRYERVMRYAVEVTYKNNPLIKAHVHTLAQAEFDEGDEQVAEARKALQVAVEHTMVRDHLKLDSSVDVTTLLSGGDIRKIITLECQRRHQDAQYYLNAQKRRAKPVSCVFAHQRHQTPLAVADIHGPVTIERLV